MYSICVSVKTARSSPRHPYPFRLKLNARRFYRNRKDTQFQNDDEIFDAACERRRRAKRISDFSKFETVTSEARGTNKGNERKRCPRKLWVPSCCSTKKQSAAKEIPNRASGDEVLWLRQTRNSSRRCSRSSSSRLLSSRSCANMQGGHRGSRLNVNRSLLIFSLSFNLHR